MKSRMVWAGTSDWKETATAREQVCYQMAFQERDVRAEVNGDRGPGISERKLGESSVMFLIDNEGGDDR